MGVYLPNMEIPTSCADCPIGNVLYCPLMPGVPALWAEYANAVLEERMHSDCPLISIQKHERLIDADALADVFRSFIAIYDSCPFNLQDIARRNELQSALAEVINAPTIILSEEETHRWKEYGDNQPTSKDKVFCCPVCGKGRLFEWQLTSFCPHCGTKLSKLELSEGE